MTSFLEGATIVAPSESEPGKPIMSILSINKLALDLVARDFSDGHAPNNAGPTKTARALAIIHMAARDAYAQVTGAYAAKLAGLPAPPAGLPATDAAGAAAVLGAGIRAATLLYPDFAQFINDQSAMITATADPEAMFYGCEIAEKWIASRQNDGAGHPQTDSMHGNMPGHHRPDPVSRGAALGRTWGQTAPFILNDVATDAPLLPPPGLTTADYANAFDEVFVFGRDNIVTRSPAFRLKALIGVFWGYDGSNKLGTPPRLYNQVVGETTEFKALPHSDQVNVLAAINAAMADAGIAAWYWKYVYDFWRPVVAIREAEAGFGPTGLGDNNAIRIQKGDPFWLPFGAPRSNPIPPIAAGAAGDNFTPNFPAYPSGHATFGTACFETFAKLVGKTPATITVKFVSGEFAGVTNNPFTPGTTDHTGALRPRWEQTFTLQTAIEQNAESRIWLGVHWRFDATGGEIVGHAVALKAIAAFT